MQKFLVVLSYLDFPYYAGLSKRIEGLTTPLLHNGVKPVIISPQFRQGSPLPYPGDLIRIDLRKMRRFSIFSKLVKLLVLILFSLISFIYVWKLKFRFSDDVKVIQYESIYSSLPALLLKFLFNIKIIGDDIIFSVDRNFFYRLFQTFVIRYTDYIIVSNLTSYKIVKNSLSPDQGILYVPNGIVARDIDFSHKNFKRIVFVGALSYEENIDAVNSLSELSNFLMRSGQSYEIFVIGGPLHKKFERVKKDHGRLHFLGFVKDDEYEKILESAYIGLLPFFTKIELGGQRIKALEYFSHGLLIISTLDGIRGIRGLTAARHYIKVTHQDELNSTVGEVLENPSSYLKIAQSGKETVTENYRWEKVTQPYVKLIRYLFNKNQPT